MALKKILLKLTGNVMLPDDTGRTAIYSIIEQIQALSDQYLFGIVIGGGNLFRGSQHGKMLNLNQWPAHICGMLATCINGIIIHDLCIQKKIPAALFSAFDCPETGSPITPSHINQALEANKTVIFSGGTGNPYFTTDTNAVLRALEIGAIEIWKGTDVDGIYSADPKKDTDSQFINEISYDAFVEKKLSIMDTTAITMAAEHEIPIRIFNVLKPDTLKLATENTKSGSYIKK